MVILISIGREVQLSSRGSASFLLLILDIASIILLCMYHLRGGNININSMFPAACQVSEELLALFQFTLEDDIDRGSVFHGNQKHEAVSGDGTAKQACV